MPGKAFAKFRLTAWLIVSLSLAAVAGSASLARCGETGGDFSAGDAIVKPLDLAREAAKAAGERARETNEMMRANEGE